MSGDNILLRALHEIVPGNGAAAAARHLGQTLGGVRIEISSGKNRWLGEIHGGAPGWKLFCAELRRGLKAAGCENRADDIISYLIKNHHRDLLYIPQRGFSETLER